MRVITICGSLRFEADIKYWAEKLALDGNCVLSIVFPIIKEKNAYTPEQLEILGTIHKKKIDLSDAIFVVNKDGYIGNAVKNEIEYAKEKGKEILFLENNSIS